MCEAPLEALSSRAVTYVPESSKTRQETAETEQLWYTLSEEEDLEAARVEPEKQKYLLQQPPAVQFPPPLKTSPDKG